MNLSVVDSLQQDVESTLKLDFKETHIFLWFPMVPTQTHISS